MGVPVGAVKSIPLCILVSKYLENFENDVKGTKVAAYRAAREAISNHYMEISFCNSKKSQKSDDLYESIYWSPNNSANNESRGSKDKRPRREDIIVEVEEEQTSFTIEAEIASQKSPFLGRPLPKPPQQFEDDDLDNSSAWEKTGSYKIKAEKVVSLRELLSQREVKRDAVVMETTTKEAKSDNFARTFSLRVLSPITKRARNNRLTRSMLPGKRKKQKSDLQKTAFENPAFVNDNGDFDNDYVEMVSLPLGNTISTREYENRD